jgi:L-threonylcarbamoyladenylate synthase
VISYKELIKKLILSDKLIALPTDTVFALIANAKSPAAIEKLYKLKERQKAKPFAIFVNSFSMLEEIAHFDNNTKLLFQNFSALTLILNKKENSFLAKNLNLTNQTIAVRIPNNPLILDLISELNFPLAATSANPSGKEILNSKKDIEAAFKDRIDFILDEEHKATQPSTIIDLSAKTYKIIRQGDITKQQLEEVIGCKIT